MPLAEAGPPAHRRGDHAVGHLPRPAAAADQAAGRSRLPGRQRRRAAGAELRPQARAGLPGRARLRPRDRGAARVRQCRGRLRLQRQHLVDNSRWDDEDELAETYTRRKGFAYGRSGRPVQQARCCRACWPACSWPTRTSTRSSSASPPSTPTSTRWAASAAPSSAPRAADAQRAPGLHRRPDPRRGRCARWRTGGAGNPHPHAQPEVVRRHAQARLRRRAPDRGARDQHHGLVGHHGPGQPWVYQQLTETFMLDPAMRERLAQLNPTASAKVANRLLEASRAQVLATRRRDARSRCARRRRTRRPPRRRVRRTTAHEGMNTTMNHVPSRHQAPGARNRRARLTARAACRCSSTRT
jgi:hypothetical protein